jgi:hypothetical protein
MGLNSVFYWISTILIFSFYYLVTGLFFIILQLAFTDPTINFTNPGLLLMIVFIMGLVVISMSVLTSTMFNSTNASYLFCFLFMTASIIVAEFLSSTVFTLENIPSWWFWIHPIFSFYRTMYIMYMKCSNRMCISSFPTDKYPISGGEIALSCLVMSIEFLLMSALAVYFNQVLPQKFGVKRNPLFFLEPVRKLLPKISFASGDTAIQITARDMSAGVHENEVLSGDWDNEPLVIKALCWKNINHLTLSVRSGECANLVATNIHKNLLSILKGNTTTTKGTVTIAGFPLEKIDDAHRNMGIMSLRDALWEELTIEEHLFFYTRIRGVVKVVDHVQLMVRCFDLHPKTS